jgi:phosphatidylserine/phosphatidylglycerophosphate/cardiolipin synthase-like enzyme
MIRHEQRMGFADHSAGDLKQTAAALRDGRLTAPFSAVALARLDVSDPGGLAGELNALADAGFLPNHMAILLDRIVDDRDAATRTATALELVVSGPDVREEARDTAVVVEQLFNEARSSVLLVGFAIFDGSMIFRRLAERLDETPGLEADFCLDISRRGADTTRESDLVARFAHEFRQQHWPGRRLPNLYFDPRGLAATAKERAVLHAKCIVIDDSVALITSANPTPAAYGRNIEVGIVVRGGMIPHQIADHFRRLIRAGLLRRV